MIKDSDIYKDGKYQKEYMSPEQEQIHASVDVSEALNRGPSLAEIHNTKNNAKVAAAVNPSHYKGHLPASKIDYQWMHTQWWKSRQEGLNLIKELNMTPNTETEKIITRAFYVSKVRQQADKYHSRFGQKDQDIQELQKAQWYLKAAELAYTGPFHENGMPYLPDEVK